MVTRRSVLACSTQLAVLAHWPGLALANREGEERLVVVILRGALDGLAAVAPYAEPRYSPLRGPLSLPSPNGAGNSLKLDGLFTLHPALTRMHEIFAAGELAVVHAVATPYRERSHFDGQAVLENGSAGTAHLRSGWLNRVVAEWIDEPRGSAIALAQNVPLVLRGEASVASWSPSGLTNADEDTFARVADLYAGDALLAARLEEGLRARAIAGEASANMGRSPRARDDFDALAAAAARFLAAADGPRIAVLESTGWDTHANQGADQGQLATRLGRLDSGLSTLKRDLGRQWTRTVVAVVTEFGRTVAVNGTRGTDHGTGGCAFLAGGAVAGGRVVGDWPGLAERDLHEGRDLRATTDLRAIFKGVLRDHFGLDERALANEVFPGSAGLKPLDGLIRSA